mmetsp:Transcript_36053/g.85549  ORF Transcript_36053/g.85549 Transcript_36053/m.85549 type:complete len:120 (+) Transcript_36053:476-835(+)
MLAFSLQVFVRLSTVMAFFALTSDTMYIKTTQYGKFFWEFRGLFITALSSSLLYFGMRSWYLAMVAERFPPMAIWTMNGNAYWVMYSVSRLGNLVYYFVLVVSSQAACKERLYTQECLE